MARAGMSRRTRNALSQVLLGTLAVALLLTGFTGRAGVQVLDRDHAARLFPLHLHDVLGEREYVAQHQGPAPFIAGHCHAAYGHGDPPPSPDDIQAASALAGSAWCMSADIAPAAPPAQAVMIAAQAVPDGILAAAPLLPPPRA